MCSVEHARRTSRHPEPLPLRCCLRLRETTPVPLVQVPSLLAQMRPGSLVLSTSKSAALYNSLHALLSKDLELPVFIIPLCFASMVYHWIEPATAESVVPFTPVRHWTQPLCVADCSLATDARPWLCFRRKGASNLVSALNYIHCRRISLPVTHSY